MRQSSHVTTCARKVVIAVPNLPDLSVAPFGDLRAEPDLVVTLIGGEEPACPKRAERAFPGWARSLT